MEVVHEALDLAGMGPGVVGVVADGTNAYLYVKERDWENAGLSILSLGLGLTGLGIVVEGVIKLSKIAMVKRGIKFVRERIAAAFRGARIAPRLISASRKSLDDFLKRVWLERHTIGYGRQDKRVYDFYKEAQEANRLTMSVDTYREKVNKIRDGRTVGTSLPSGGFDHFNREGFDMFNEAHLATIRERVYINVDADSAPALMQKIVEDIIDNKDAFPNVVKGKLTMAEDIGKRPEGITVYTKSKAEADRVVDKIRQYQSENPGYFKTETPPMTEPVAPGVSIGSEPLGSRGETSFGLVRSRAIQEALAEAVQHQETEEQFVQRVLEHFRRRGIDPDNPHRNLPPGGSQ